MNYGNARGTSGSVVAARTLLVKKGETSLAVSPAQHRLLKRLLGGGTDNLYVKGAEVRTARALDPLFGTLHDEGAPTEGNPDGERWTFTVAPDVKL